MSIRRPPPIPTAAVNIDVMKIDKVIPGASTLLGWMGIGGGDKKDIVK